MHDQLLSFDVWTKTIRFFARGTSLISIGVLLLFLFGERFDPGSIKLSEWIGLLFFPFGVAVGMLMSWRHEVEGSFLSIGSLVGFYLVCGVVSGTIPDSWAFLIFTTPAFLFLLSGMMSKIALEHQHAHFRHS